MRFSILIILAAAGAPAFAQAGRDVTAMRVEGAPVSGVLSSIRDRTVQISTDEPLRLKSDDLIALIWKNRPVVRKPSDPAVLLANGDVLHVDVEYIGDEFLIGSWARFVRGPVVKIPLETVRGVLFAGGGSYSDRARTMADIASARERDDRLWLANGDALSGTVVSLDEKGLVVTTAVGRTVLDRAGIRALAFSADLVSMPELKGPAALATLVDGSRLHALDAELGGADRIRLRTLCGPEFELPLAAVSSLHFLGGRAVHLSDLEPIEYRFEPYFSLEWPWRRDRNVSGGPLRLRKVDYPKGLGVHSQCEISYRLEGGYRHFQAVAGIDDETGGRGNAVFRVLLDGVSAFESPAVGGSDAPIQIGPLDVSHARRLTLRVEYGGQADILDRADWCDAVLLK
jgi:hypothetical protein